MTSEQKAIAELRVDIDELRRETLDTYDRIDKKLTEIKQLIVQLREAYSHA